MMYKVLPWDVKKYRVKKYRVLAVYRDFLLESNFFEGERAIQNLRSIYCGKKETERKNNYKPTLNNILVSG